MKNVLPVVPPSWLSWSSWGPCSRTCEGGVKERSRTCDGTGCIGERIDYEKCGDGKCPGKHTLLLHACVEFKYLPVSDIILTID